MAALFGWPPPALAQDPAADTVPPAGAQALLDLDLRLAEMASRLGPLGGGRALVTVRPDLRVGVAGHQVLERLDDIPSRTGPERTMAFGYAGVVAEWMPPVALPVFLRFLAGAGTVTVRDRAVGTRVGSDIVGVMESEAVYELLRMGPAGLQAGIGYRMVYSVDGPVRIVAEDVRSPFASLSLRLGPF